MSAPTKPPQSTPSDLQLFLAPLRTHIRKWMLKTYPLTANSTTLCSVALNMNINPKYLHSIVFEDETPHTLTVARLLYIARMFEIEVSLHVKPLTTQNHETPTI